MLRITSLLTLTGASGSEFFGNWFSSPEIWNDIQRSFRKGRFVHIKNALREHVAQSLYSELQGQQKWHLRQGYQADYQFRGSSIMKEDLEYQTKIPQVRNLFRYLDTEGVRKSVGGALGGDINGPFDGFVSMMQRGDSAAPHTDVKGYEESREFPHGDHRRSVAFVLHMTKDWDPRWGGELVWAQPIFHIAPAFNSLTMFPSHHMAFHFIQPIANTAPASAKRISISGWFTTRSIAKAIERENSLQQLLCKAFGGCDGLMVNGRASIDGEGKGGGAMRLEVSDKSPYNSQYCAVHSSCQTCIDAMCGWCAAADAGGMGAVKGSCHIDRNQLCSSKDKSYPMHDDARGDGAQHYSHANEWRGVGGRTA
jgi:hypothetical protein